MVSVRSILVLSAITGISSAGKCKPETPKILATSETTGSISTSTPLAGPSTTLADTPIETSVARSSTETWTDALDPSLTTSYIAQNAETPTTERIAATTSNFPVELAPTVVTCPSETTQCLGTMDIQCNGIIAILGSPTPVDDINECVHMCASDESCTAFTYWQTLCWTTNMSTSDLLIEADPEFSGGIKGTC
ncbi:hypothetical protein ACLX1H_008012 [Fusarium chlamydosporum]